MRAPSTQELLGERYQLGDVIGIGGMAVVYAATDLRLQRDVAVKVLRSEQAAVPALRARFEAEARLAASVNDEHVVAVFDNGEQDGVPFIVMERLSGRTLRDEIAEGPLSEERARAIVGDVLAGLQAAHAMGVLHRDVKPDNVLLPDGGAAKLTDFGIAKSDDNLDATATGAVLGTPSYLAPERLQGAPASVASDVYSVGVVLYEELTATKPFRADTPLGVVHAIVHSDAPPLRELRPDVGADLVAIVEQAMAKDPAARFADAAAMRAALTGGAVGPEATIALPVSRPVQGPPAPAAATEVAPLLTVLPPRRRGRGLAVALVALLLLLGIAAATSSLGGSGIAPPPTTVAQTTAPPTTVATTVPTTVVAAPPALAPKPEKHHK